MTISYWRVWGLSSAVGILAAGTASAQSSNVSGRELDELRNEVQALQRKIYQLEGKVAKTEAKTERVEKNAHAPSPIIPGKAEEAKAAVSSFDGAYDADVPRAAAKAPVAAPSAIAVMSSGNAPSICTPDQLNCIGLTGRLHLDVGGYNYRPATGLGINSTTGAPITSTPGGGFATTPQTLDDGFNVRRARLGVVGKFMGDWNFALIYDFGGSSDGFGGLAPGSLPGGHPSGVDNAFLSYTGFSKWTGLTGFAIEGGIMTMPYTLDEATSSNDIMFMERPSSVSVASSIAAGGFRSAGGLRGYNDWIWAAAYATGPKTGAIHSDTTSVTALVPAGCSGTIPPGLVCNTVNVTTAGASEQYGSVARLTWQALSGQGYSVHIGGDVEVLFSPPVGPATLAAPGKRTLTLSDPPELRIDPTRIQTTGAIANVSGAEVYSLEAAAGWGPLFFQGEYFWYRINREVPGNVTPAPASSSLNFNGGYAEASWTITGESRPYIPATGAYGRITPNNPVNPGGTGWGAWEIAARYSVMNLNDQVGQPFGVAGGQQNIFTAGLNWYVNKNIMFKLNYLHASIDKEAFVISKTNANSVATGNVGANFDAVAGRMQIAF